MPFSLAPRSTRRRRASLVISPLVDHADFVGLPLTEAALGSGYVTSFDTSTDKVSFRVSSDALTLFDVSIRYAGIYGEKRTSLVLNGDSTSEVSLPASTSWVTASGGQVLLKAGDNSIDIVSNWGWYVMA